MAGIKLYDTRDIYRTVRGTSLRGLGIKEKEFSSIVKKVNERIAQSILEGDLVRLPCSMGTIIPIQKEAMYVNKKGKVVICKPVDWKATLALWEEDEEAKKENFKVRHDVDTVYRIIYNKKGANYRNKFYIQFKPIKPLIEKFIQRAVDGEISCYIS